MGAGIYSTSASESRTISRAHIPTQQVFTSRGCHAAMDPRGLNFRESCDSAEHPASVAVAFFLDVTRSMDVIPAGLAQRTLPHFAKMILPVLPDAQILFGAVGDAEDGDKAPLQIGQWESSDELVDQWLTRIYLEGGGGPNGEESYDLALLFAARMAQIDCWKKRGEKGYLFLTGDERPRDRVNSAIVNRAFGREVLDRDVPLGQIVQEAVEKFHMFFLIPDLRRAEECETAWRKYFGDNVIVMEHSEDTALVAATLIAITQGRSFPELSVFKKWIEQEQGVNAKIGGRVYRAVRSYAATRAGFEPVRPVSKPGLTIGNEPSVIVRFKF